VPELSTADKNLHADHNEAQHLTGQKILKIISNYLFKKKDECSGCAKLPASHRKVLTEMKVFGLGI